MLKKGLGYNLLISTAGRFFNVALTLVIIGLLTRYLGQTGFGDYSIILAFLFFFVILADLGLYSICLREISRPGANKEKIVSNVLTIRILAGFFIFLLAPLVGWFFPYSLNVKLGLIIGLFGFWFLSGNQILTGVFQKYLHIEWSALADLLGKGVQLALVFFFIAYRLSFLYLVSAMSLGSLTTFLFGLALARRYVRFSFQVDLAYWREILRESLPLGLATVFTMVYFKLDAIMLSLIKGSAEVGIYSLAHKIVENLLFFPAMFVGLVMPLLSEYAFIQPAKFHQTSQTVFNFFLALVVPLLIGTFFLAQPIVLLLGGQEFIDSASVLDILILAGSIIFLATLFAHMLIALKKQKNLAYVYGFGALLNLVLNFFLIPAYSYYGAALATVLTEVVVTIWMLLILYQLIKRIPSFNWSLLSRYGLAGGIMALFLYLLADWPVLVLIVLGSLIYGTALYLLRVFSHQEIKQMILRPD